MELRRVIGREKWPTGIIWECPLAVCFPSSTWHGVGEYRRRRLLAPTDAPYIACSRGTGFEDVASSSFTIFEVIMSLPVHSRS